MTGSRIQRKDLTSSSPLVTIDQAQLESHSSVDVVTELNMLPQYFVAQSPVTEPNDVQASPYDTPGISTVSLRGLGANRSLVLVDGHRATPADLLMDIDINTIPEAAIDHIETITGGASAVYGADAMGGVTNFVLKKNFQGAQIDVQDSVTQAGDGNETRVDGIMGTNFADNKGNILMGLEYYNRSPALMQNHSFYTNNWYDPNSTATSTFVLFPSTGMGGFETFLNTPSQAVLAAEFPAATADGYVAGSALHPNGVCGYSGYILQGLFVNPNGSLVDLNLPVSVSGFQFPGGDTNPETNTGYTTVNGYDSTECNSSLCAPPGEITTSRFENPYAEIDIPQTRYSFWSNGTYDITDNVQFYMTSRFADSITQTYLSTPNDEIFGWEAEVPFNPKTDSPINPSDLNSTTPAATVNAIFAAFEKNPSCASVSCNPYYNPSYIGVNKPGAEHPVPWQMAADLLSALTVPCTGTKCPWAGGQPNPDTAFGTAFDGPVSCSNGVSAAINADCAGGADAAPLSWITDWYPMYTQAQRSTAEQDEMFQVSTGFKFNLFADWTGTIYYSRGQTLDYLQSLGDPSLERFRSVVDAPDYGGNGDAFQGNAQGASPFFGTSVVSTCSGGMYGALLQQQTPSASCNAAYFDVLQTEDAIQQDDTEADFNGTLGHLPAGDVSAAVGWEERREAGQFQPDNLQATYSFLDQPIGLYPEGVTNAEIYDTDGYGEVFLPLVSDVKFMQKLSLDVGGRYSVFSNGIPSTTTYKISPEWQVTKSFRFRGGYNHAVRAPNLAELYMGAQEIFGGGPVFGDPCSVRSPAPFGAGGAAPDYSASGSKTGAATTVASGQTLAGATSTYLICLAQMGSTTGPTAANPYGNSLASEEYYGITGNQFDDAAAAIFDWINQEGNPHLTPETANTWTGGFVFSNLGDNPWIAGLNGSVDWWQIDIDHAIELTSPDEASSYCYSQIVTTFAEAETVAQSAACQNVGRNLATGATTTLLEQYNNLATIGMAGVDTAVNWFAQLADLGVKVPGAISFSTNDTFMDYYKTKASPYDFDVDINWKGSQGPDLMDLNPGAFAYKLNATIGYVMPSWSVNFGWNFYPSVNTEAEAEQAAIIANNERVLSTGKGTLLSWIPQTSIAAPSFNLFSLNATWTVNKVWQLRAGIDDLFGSDPPITGASTGYPTSKPLSSYCTAALTKLGCENPGSYVFPTDGVGITNPAMGYWLYGRTFFVGAKASF